MYEHNIQHSDTRPSMTPSKAFFRFPKGRQSAGGASTAPVGNAGFADDTQDDESFA